MPANLYSLSELRTATDDVLIATLPGMGFKQSNTHLDVRLAFGYVAVVAAALAGGYDYKIGFEKAKLYTAIGVVVYFAAYAAMNLWQFVVERNLVFAGSKDDVSIEVRTTTSTEEPRYKVSILVKRPGPRGSGSASSGGVGGVPGAAAQIGKVEKSEMFTKWFDVDGNVVKEPFATWITGVVQDALKLGDKKAL